LYRIFEQKGAIKMSGRYIRQEPYVGEHGIYVPDKEYVPEGCVSTYRCVITREMFVAAYEKWIKPSFNASFDFSEVSYDDADCWCE
jgi:hypothetical protein